MDSPEDKRKGSPIEGPAQKTPNNERGWVWVNGEGWGCRGGEAGWEERNKERSPPKSEPPTATAIYLGELPGIGAAEERGAGAEADGSSAAEDVLGDRPVQGQHRQLVTYFH